MIWLLKKWVEFRVFRQTMLAWVGEGGRPVSSGVSQSRADMCLSCPHNWRGIVSQETASDAAKRLMEAKNRLKMSVRGEDGLYTCDLCHCYLPLKIHVPWIHIRRFQREETRAAIMAGKSDCWQLNG
jgi:hypothetical protein